MSRLLQERDTKGQALIEFLKGSIEIPLVRRARKIQPADAFFEVL